MKPLEILLVEDEPGDVRLTQHGLKRSDVQINLSVCRDGDEALEFLRRGSRYPDAPRPELVLLDLNLPTISGFQVLEELKRDPGLRAIPVIVLTTSTDLDDINRAYEAYVNAYMSKPIEFEQFVELINGLSRYWFKLCRLPDGEPGSDAARGEPG